MYVCATQDSFIIILAQYECLKGIIIDLLT